MTRGRRTIAYCAATLLLAAALLLAAPAQARYTPAQTRWLAAYQPPAALSGDYLSAEGSTLLLADWSPAGEGAAKTVTLQVTSAAPIAPPPAEGEAAESAAQPLGLTVTAVGGVTAQAAYTVYGVDAHTAQVTVTVTASAVTTKTTATVTLQVSHNGMWLTGTLRIPLLPPDTAGSTPIEAGTLFVPENSMTQYDPQYPFCVSYGLPEGCPQGEMILNGDDFPEGTRYSIDGSRYITLLESRPIPAAGDRIFLRLPDGSAGGMLTLTLTAGGKQDTLSLPAASRGDTVTLGADGVPTVTLPAWDSRLTLTAEVEYLTWVEEPLPAADPAAPAEPPQTQRVVKYAAAAELAQCVWAPVLPESGTEEAAEPNTEAAPTAQTLTVEPMKEGQQLPAGTYRLTVRWSLDSTVVTERAVSFFVAR